MLETTILLRYDSFFKLKTLKKFFLNYKTQIKLKNVKLFFKKTSMLSIYFF